MHHATSLFIHTQLSRWTRRFLLGGALVAAVAAMVAFGRNGVPEDSLGSNPFDWASPPARYCQAMILATPDDPEAAPAQLAPVEDLEEENDWEPVDPGAVVNPNGKITTRCQVQGRCVHNGVETAYTFDWCCFAGKGCYIKTGGAWISLANWLRFGGGACVVQVGCN